MATSFSMANRIVLALSGAFFTAHSHAQMADPGLPPATTVVLTGFAVNKPIQVQDVDDMAQGFPKEVARRLAQNTPWQIRTAPHLLSFDWQQDVPSGKLLNQMGATYASRYVVAGEIRNAGTKNDTILFGLMQKKTRAIEVDIRIYDAQSGKLLARQDFSRTVAGDVTIGREHVFGGAAFSSTLYGKLIGEVADQVASLVSTTIVAQH
ncbi:flagella assembly protein FlgT middle domain-containing protein [Undibacterium sp. Ji50W]|uniref:flagella assembly protein FlgT middle domain-containing protein n=1 Tax=Undibacterium TaxID=401469 RepID=UPI003BF2B2FD